ncbi:hypothetical protein LOK49_LG11G01613 [Camellia lanceoleosa]|uniref:Uncharacterized protein n=1 Tax=Camellia lanceoleosa TaxID=1840588 RepID=A0ACC0G3X9_9ERIC|nr:hypothetical protein LOK49_LG11G01613 [Camellia lanceoleosa]
MTPQPRQQDSQQAESTYVLVDVVDHASKNLTDSLPLKESCSADKANDDVEKTKEVQISKKLKLVNADVGGEGEQPVQSPKSLAFKIEVELFKLFGGVNKKYKEKGRSLLFNLKD